MSEQVKPASDLNYAQNLSHIENDETGEVIPFDGGEIPDGFTALFRYCPPASEQKPVAVCDTKNRIRWSGEDDNHRYSSAPSWVEVGAEFYAAPQPDYKAQRDALLEAHRKIVSDGDFSSPEGMKRIALDAIASAKGGA